MKKKLKPDLKTAAALKRNLFEKQLELRLLLYEASSIVDRGKASLAFKPKAMTETQWGRMASLAKKIWDISSQCDGAIEFRRMFGKEPENDTANASGEPF